MKKNPNDSWKEARIKSERGVTKKKRQAHMEILRKMKNNVRTKTRRWTILVILFNMLKVNIQCKTL